MAVKPQHPSFVFPSSSNPCLSRVSIKTCFSFKRVARLDYLIRNCSYLRNKYLSGPAFLDTSKNGRNRQLFASSKNLHASWRTGNTFLLASPEDGVTVNGSSQASTGKNVEEMRIMLNEALQNEDHSDVLVQSLHDAARIFELSIKEQKLFSKLAWFSAAWLGMDRNAWVKKLSYQASVYSLLQAACEISSRGDGRDKDINVIVQRSLSRQASPLENHIQEELSSKHSEAYDWLCSEQIPMVVTSFVNYFEEDRRFISATSGFVKDKSPGTGNESEISLVMLALTCIAAITKLGPAKVSCSPFFSMIPETTGRLLDKLADFVPIPQLYQPVKSIGLRREFLVHFGPRVAACRVQNEKASDEVVFWVNLVHKQLQRAVDREKIWSRLTTSESIEVLERDLAIFGFFIALGRSTQYFLSANGFDSLDDPIEDFVRYLVGGSVLFYPQLSSISSYQLYVEVVSEELEWLPFYPGITATTNPKQSHGHKSKSAGPPNYEAIPQVLDVCSHWLKSYIKYSKWLENPSSVKAARFLSRGHNKLNQCLEELGISKIPVTELSSVGMNVSQTGKVSNSFDKALENVDEALVRLEKLLQQLHVSNSNSGKEQLKAACTNLEKIRKLKKEAEFLEASFRAKAASLQEGDGDADFRSSAEEKQQYLKEKSKSSTRSILDQGNRFGKNRGMWSLFMRSSSNNTSFEPSGSECVEQPTTNIDVDSEQNEIRRFELLRNELIELEKRVQRSANLTENDEETSKENLPDSNNVAGDGQLVKAQKKENVIEKTFDKLKETSTDVWQGTQLLAIDATAAMELLRRSLVGDELTEKEKQALRRTMTDLASVVPIGVLMLLPVTAVGHAAMLAAIKRYVPSLIPSTYGPERLNLLRQLEKVKEMQSSESESEESTDEIV